MVTMDFAAAQYCKHSIRHPALSFIAGTKGAGPSNGKRLPDKPGRLNEPANRLHYAESDAVTLFRPLRFAS